MVDPLFEHRVIAALRAHVPTDAAARHAIMARVRAVPAADRPTRRRLHITPSHGTRHSIVGLALAAGIGSITTLSSIVPLRQSPPMEVVAGVIGDSVAHTLRDTLRLVRLFFDAPNARRVAVLGDFNDWRADATPLQRDPREGRWSTTVALRDGHYRYAFVVDGTRWVVDPAARHLRGDDGRAYSLLHVTRATN